MNTTQHGIIWYIATILTLKQLQCGINHNRLKNCQHVINAYIKWGVKLSQLTQYVGNNMKFTRWDHANTLASSKLTKWDDKYTTR